MLFSSSGNTPYDNDYEMPDFVDALPDTQPESGLKKARTQIDELLPEAIGIIKEVIHSGDASLDQKFKAAKAIIDLTSLGKDPAPNEDQPSNALSIIRDLTLDQLTELKSMVHRIIEEYEKNKKQSGIS